MRLYSRWQNSAGERVRIGLNLKGINCEYVPISGLTKQEYLRINPQGLLPTLEVGGEFIAQSSAILEYLEEMFPKRSFLPSDPIVKAQARAFANHISSEMHALTQMRIQKMVGKGPAKNWVQHWHDVGFHALEQTVRQRNLKTDFCFGDEPGWADLHLIPQLANARRFGVDLAPYPLLLEVEANCIKLEAFVNARPENQTDYPGFKPNE
ncbi:maleylacetoacetate isomerase [Maritalea sp.]|uniref:maleylacetoacetate isomerase n=1 Tax=Maritalea sp. TaxID=2003361 RepID=UPI003EF337D8